MSTRDFSQSPARIARVIDKALAERRIVGTVVLVARHGEIVFRGAAGYSDREAGKGMREDAIFRLASIAKPIVTAAAMRLVEEGRLALDAPVTRWPDFRPALPDGSTPEITIHHLLTHSSGLGYAFLEPPDGPHRKLNISDGLDQPGLSLEENLYRIAAAPLAFAPGTGWRYSPGLDVIGGVLERIEARSLPDVVREKVTGPLGLEDTDFSIRDPSRLANAYADGDPEPVLMTDGIAVPLYGLTVPFVPSRILDPRSYPSGGAGVAGTADDILRFLEAIRSGGAPILHRKTVETMATDQVGPTAETQGPGWASAMAGQCWWIPRRLTRHRHPVLCNGMGLTATTGSLTAPTAFPSSR